MPTTVSLIETYIRQPMIKRWKYAIGACTLQVRKCKDFAVNQCILSDCNLKPILPRVLMQLFHCFSLRVLLKTNAQLMFSPPQPTHVSQ